VSRNGRFRVLSDGTLLIQLPQESDAGKLVEVVTDREMYVILH